MSQASCAKTVQWLRFLLEEMGFESWVDGPTPLYGDNDGATTFARDEYINQANRYYVKEAHFCKRAFLQGYTDPTRVSTTNNLADAMTKALPSTSLAKLVPMMTGNVPIALTPMHEPEQRNAEPATTSDSLSAHIPPKVKEIITQRERREWGSRHNERNQRSIGEVFKRTQRERGILPHLRRNITTNVTR